MVHGDGFMILPNLLLNHSPKILEFNKKDDKGEMKTSMCLRRSYHVHRRGMASQPNDQPKPPKIVALQRKLVPMIQPIFSP